MTHGHETSRNPVTLHFSAEIVTDLDGALEKQQRLLYLVRELGGVTCEVSLESHPDIIETPAMNDGRRNDFNQNLTMDIGAALQKVAIAGWLGRKSMLMRTENILRREGAHTVRDVLAMGRNRIRDIHNAGAGSLEIIEESLRRADPSSTWQDSSSLADIRRLYPNLLDIPCSVISEKLPNSLTIKDMLSLPLAQLAAEHFETYSTRPPSVDMERAVQARHEARAFLEKLTAGYGS
jgi:hypothetical protein